VGTDGRGKHAARRTGKDGVSRRGLAAAALLAFVCAAAAPVATPAADGRIVVGEAVLALQPGPVPPASDDPRWQRVPLVDLWGVERRAVAVEGWYRAEVSLPAPPSELWAVYLPRVALNAAVLVNGEQVGDGGRMDEPIARNWNRPLLFTVPPGLLHAGSNTVHIRVKMIDMAPGYLGPFEVGPERVLRPSYERRYLRQVTLAQMATLATLVTALLLGIIYFRRDPDGNYRWFAAGVFCWAINSMDSFLRDVPVPTPLWQWVAGACGVGFVPCFIIAFHRALGLERRWTERLIAAVMLAGFAIMLMMPRLYFFSVLVVYFGVTIVLGGYLVSLIILASRRTDVPGRQARAQLLLLPGILGLGFGVHDVWWLIVEQTFPPVLLSPYIAPMAMIASGWIIIGHLAAGLTESETLNRELEQRVQEKHGELERNYERLGELERARAVAHERERIMRDMHDGMGGQLVSTLAMVEGGRFTPDRVAEALRDALDDLRLVIDSLDPVDDDLLSVLGVVRARFEPRLERHGIHFDWQVADLPAVAGLGPERVLQALRIVQEAVTNVVKHARAHTITVRTGAEADSGGTAGVFVEVRDDGRGMDGVRAAGRGLANMTRRAQTLGGRVAFASGAWGTSVRLWLPIQASTG
jgi:signal transduction histidine kinase